MSNVEDEIATGNRFDAFRVSPIRPVRPFHVEPASGA
jgi:hypothetical protein